MDRVAFIVLRKQNALTQAELGDLLGVSRQAIIKWEKGIHPLPVDIEQRLSAVNMAAPVQKKNASKIITDRTHPTLYRRNDLGQHVRRLSHPKWWAGAFSPFSRLCSTAQWAQINPAATVADLETYIEPTVDQARALMLDRGITLKDADAYLVHMGHLEPPPPTAQELENRAHNARLLDDTPAPRDTSPPSDFAVPPIGELDNLILPSNKES